MKWLFSIQLESFWMSWRVFGVSTLFSWYLSMGTLVSCHFVYNFKTYGVLVKVEWSWIQVLSTKFLNTFIIRFLSSSIILNNKCTWLDTNTNNVHTWVVTTNVQQLTESNFSLIIMVAVLQQTLSWLHHLKVWTYLSTPNHYLSKSCEISVRARI